MESLPHHLEYLERDSGSEADSNHVRDAIRVLRKQWFMILIPLLCVVGVVFVLTKRKPRIYQAGARLLISAPATNSNSSQAQVQGILASNQQPNDMATQMEILRSPQLMARALSQKILEKGTPQLIVSQVPDSAVVELTVYWENAEQAADIANRIAKRYKFEVQQANSKAVRMARQYVRDQLLRTKPRLEAKSLELKRFQEQNGVFELPAQTSQAVGQLASLENQRQNIELQLKAAERKIPEVQRKLALVQPKQIAGRGLAPNPLIPQFTTRLHDLYVQRAAALAEYSDNSPHLRPIDEQIKNVKEQLREVMSDKSQQVVETGSTEALNPEWMRFHDMSTDLQIQRLADGEQLRTLKAAEAKQREAMTSLPTKQYQLANLQREQEVLDKSYRDLLGQEQNLGITESTYVSGVTLFSEASANYNPVSPNWRINMTMAIVFGMMLGIGMAFAREYMGDTIDTTDHVGSALGLPVIGAIPTLRGIGRAPLLGQRELTPEMEGYHFIASALPMGHRESSLRTLLLTSTGSGYGNSTTAANLATAFAQRQKAVVLVDLDLRQPTLHRLFEIPESPGISDVIAGRRLLAEALHPTAVEGLLVMPAGSARENPIRTLSSPSLPVVLQDLANVADVVLIDSPPCVTVTDASIIAPSVDGTILLLRSGETDKSTAQSAKSLLNAVGASVLGVILNRATTGLDGFSYSRRYRRILPPALGPGL